MLSPPVPSPEWLATFRGSGTDLPEGAKTFEVKDEIKFPERNQSRTALQVLLSVPTAAAPGRRFDNELHHNFVVTGEVIRDGRLFESFNYGFQGPTAEGTAAIPMGFTRYLRPGPVTLRVLVEDVFGEQYAQIVRDLDIPSPEGLPQAAMPSVGNAPGGAAGGSGPSLQLLAPAGAVQTGVVRFSARATGTAREGHLLPRRQGGPHQAHAAVQRRAQPGQHAVAASRARGGLPRQRRGGDRSALAQPGRAAVPRAHDRAAPGRHLPRQPHRAGRGRHARRQDRRSGSRSSSTRPRSRASTRRPTSRPSACPAPTPR